jgi:hypothetical protein
MSIFKAYALATGSPSNALMFSYDVNTGFTDFHPNFTLAVGNINALVAPNYDIDNVLILFNNGDGVYRSTDGGITWNPILGTNGVSWAIGKFIDNNKVIIAGDYIALSNNGGANFYNIAQTASQIYGLPGDPTIFARALHFLNPAVGYIGIFDKLFKTTDGGNTWSALNTGAPIEANSAITSIAATNNRIYIAVRNGTTSSTIYYSIDGGSTFNISMVENSDSFFLLQVDEINYFYTYLASSSSGSNSKIYQDIGDGVWNLIIPDMGANDLSSGNQVFYKKLKDLDYHLLNASPIAKFITGDNAGVLSSYTQSGRSNGLDSTENFECGVCPPGYTKPQDGKSICIKEIVSGPLCPDGYTYEPTTGHCKGTNPFLPNCAQGCTKVQTDDAKGGCKCTVTEPFIPCLYVLIECSGELQITTDTDLSEYMGTVIKLEGYGDACFYITLYDQVFIGEITPVTVTHSYANCDSCLPGYNFYNCADPSVVITTNDPSFSGTEPGTVFTFEQYPTDCWTFGINQENPINPLLQFPVNVDKEFAECSDCYKPKYELVSCFNPEQVITTDVDLSIYLGKVVSLKGYPALCFEVREQECDCIRVVIDDVTYGFLDVSINSIGLLNDKPVYSAGDHSVYWDGEKWIFRDNSLQQDYYFSPIDTYCPYISYWTRNPEFYDNTTPVTMKIIMCNPTINTVEVDKEYVDCSCCKNKKCN